MRIILVSLSVLILSTTFWRSFWLIEPSSALGRLTRALTNRKRKPTLYELETPFVKNFPDQTQHRGKLREDNDLLGLVAPPINAIHKFDNLANLCGVAIRDAGTLGDDNLTRAAVRVSGVSQARRSLSHDFDARRSHLPCETELALRRSTEVQTVEGLGQFLSFVLLLLGWILRLVDDRVFICLPVSIDQ